MLSYFFKPYKMTFFTTLLFTAYNISSTTESISKSCPYLKLEDQKRLCVKIEHSKEPTAYTGMLECAAREFQNDVGDDVNVSFVDMSRCYPSYPRQTPKMRRADPFSKSDEESDSNKVTPALDSGPQEPCPKECPISSDMVCARCNHGIYRSFLSGCHVRMYQCKHPNEKLELVSRHACYGSGPLMGGDKPLDKDLKDRVAINKGIRTDGKGHKIALAGYLHESDFWTAPREFFTPKPTVQITWPSRRPRTESTSPKTRPITKPQRSTRTRPGKLIQETTPITTDDGNALSDNKKPDLSRSSKTIETSSITPGDGDSDYDEVTRIDVDICPNDEDQETPVDVPDVCGSTTNHTRSEDFMKVDLHPEQIEDGPPVWMVFNGGKKITSKIRADAGIMVGCDAYAGLDYSGQVTVRNKQDNDFLGMVFGYRSSSQFYLVTWKSTSSKFWLGSPSIVKADAGLHIKLVNSATGPSAYLRNALYSTESVKDQVTLLWKDPKKRGWKHLTVYSWQLIHRPHIGLIRVKVFRGKKLIVDSGNIYDKTIKGGRIGVYAFSQENIEWSKMNFKCNDKIPSNLMSELPPGLQAISVKDTDYIWNNITWIK